MESTETTRFHTRYVSYVPEAVLTAAVVAFAVGGTWIIRQAEYLGGLRADLGLGFTAAFLLKGLIPLFSLIVACVAVLRLYFGPRTPRYVLLSLVFPTVCVYFFRSSVEVPGPLAPDFLQGFQQRVLKQVDLDAVQQWLVAEGAKHAGKDYRQPFPHDFPECLVRFHPYDISVGPAVSEKGPTVEFRWYAPHGDQFGLIVGSPTSETPAGGRFILPDGWCEFRHPVRPGVYVFTRG